MWKTDAISGNYHMRAGLRQHPQQRGARARPANDKKHGQFTERWIQTCSIHKHWYNTEPVQSAEIFMLTNLCPTLSDHRNYAF